MRRASISASTPCSRSGGRGPTPRPWRQGGWGHRRPPPGACWVSACWRRSAGAAPGRTAAALGLATVTIGALSFIGYLFGANPLYAVPPLTAIALPTTTMIVAVAVGLVMALGDSQPMRTLLEPSGAGLLARRALPFVILMPLVLGLLRLRGQQAGWYDTGMGTALLVLGLIIGMSAVLWWCVEAVSAHERALATATRTVSENEARFRRLADAIPQIVWVLDAEGKVTFINQQWRDYTGWSDAAVGDTSFGVHPEDLRPLRAGWDRARQAGLEYTAEFRLRAASDGRFRWHLCRVVPIRHEGQVVQWYGTSTDIHDRKLAEEQLRQAAKMEAIGRLAGGVAHDFNNQLNAVSGFAAFAAQDPGLGAGARHDLEEILKATERMAGLTRQLLAFSRQQVLQPETLQLNAAVLDGSSLLQRLIGSHIEFRLDLTADPTWIQVDRAQLLQVLMNLAINARDAMSRDGLLDIRTGRLEVTAAGAAGWVPGRSAARLVRAAVGQRQRRRHPARAPAPRLRALLHHQGTGTGHGARSRYGARDRHPVAGAYQGGEPPG